MKIKPSQITRTIGILTDPSPTWMAVVSNGANQTPWNSVKAEAIATAQPPKGKTMPLKKGKGAQRDAVIRRLTFSKSLFETEASVQKYLDAKGFTETEIEDDEDVWTVKSTEDVSHLTLGKALSTPTKTAGVFAFVSEVQKDVADGDEDEDEDGDDTEASDEDDDTDNDDDADDGDEEPAAKKKAGRAKAKVIAEPKAKKKAAPAPTDDEDTDTILAFPPDAEGVQKYDFWSAYMSNEGSLTGVLRDGIGYDGVPPGVDEVMSAVFYSAGNVLESDDEDGEKKAKLEQIGQDFAAITFGLYELFKTATDNATKSATAKQFAEAFAASIKRAAALTASDNVIEPGDEDDDDAADEPAVTGKADKKLAPKAKAADDETPAWAKKLQASADAAARTAQAALAASQKVGKQLERAPTKKSLADAGDDILEPTATSKKKTETPEQREERLDRIKRDAGGMFGFVSEAPTPRGNA